MGHLIEVVVDDLTQINESVSLNLNRSIDINLYTRSVHNTQVSNVVFASLADNHELGFPQFLVVRDLIVVGFTFTDLEDTLSSIDRDLEVLEFLSIDCFECHVEFVGGSLIWEGLEAASLEVNFNTELNG